MPVPKDDEFGPIKVCIGCGFCCTKAPCVASVRLYPGAETCPALVWTGVRHVCNLMGIPGIVGEAYRKELYAGAGCCCGLNTWRIEPLQDHTKGSDSVSNTRPGTGIPKIMQQFLRAIGREWIGADALWLACQSFAGILINDGVPEEKARAMAEECLRRILGERSKNVTEFMG